MKTKMLTVLFFLFSGFSAFAYDSGIAIQSDQGATMHVYVNGKLYNKHAGKFVRVRSFHGLFHLQVRVLNPYTKLWTTLKKDIHVEKGFEFQFKVVFNDRKAELKEIRKYPVYSRYFLNPVLYNRHPIT